MCQFAERCRLLVERVDWVVQSLPEDTGTGDGLSKASSSQTLHFVESAATELEDAVCLVHGIEAMLSEKQADIIKKDDAEESAAANLPVKMREYETLEDKLEDDRSQIKTSMDT